MQESTNHTAERKTYAEMMKERDAQNTKSKAEIAESNSKILGNSSVYKEAEKARFGNQVSDKNIPIFIVVAVGLMAIAVALAVSFI